MRTPHYRAWIKPIEMWADEIIMEFTSYGIPPRFAAYMQDKRLIFEQDDLIIEQYTGLKDKNGVEIYEGDIVHVGNSSLTDEVKCHAGGMWMLNDIALISGICCPCEVIGNIHENPELVD